jgi:hypothetical protein
MNNFNLAKPDLKLEVKVDQFNGFLRDFSKRLASSATMQQVVDYEVGRVLERSIELTGKANKAKMRSRIAELRMITLNGKRIPLMNKKSGRWQRFPDAQWAAINSRKREMLALMLGARGLSAQSWYLLAQQIGQKVEATNYVKAALPTKRYAAAAVQNNVSFSRNTNKAGIYSLEITNKMPILRFNPPKGLAALFSAIAGRIRYFKDNLRTGVFNDAKAVAAKYGGIKVV